MLTWVTFQILPGAKQGQSNWQGLSQGGQKCPACHPRARGEDKPPVGPLRVLRKALFPPSRAETHVPCCPRKRGSRNMSLTHLDRAISVTCMFPDNQSKIPSSLVNRSPNPRQTAVCAVLTHPGHQWFNQGSLQGTRGYALPHLPPCGI